MKKDKNKNKNKYSIRRRSWKDLTKTLFKSCVAQLYNQIKTATFRDSIG